MTEKITFEQASKKLDDILKKLEAGNLKLNESVTLFEEADQLLKICSKHFEVAKGKIMVVHNDKEELFED